MVTTEVQSLASHNHPPQQQMRIMATGLLALNLASITGVRSESAHDEFVLILRREKAGSHKQSSSTTTSSR
jgi:hypothetical protein